MCKGVREDFFFYAIGNCVLLHKSAACSYVQLYVRNKSCILFLNYYIGDEAEEELEREKIVYVSEAVLV